MADLTLRDIDKHYGDVHAVRNLSLTIPAGEFTVLVGPSGCGKSTLLRSIAGLETITAGEISLDGKSITRLRPRDRDLAMVYPARWPLARLLCGLPKDDPAAELHSAHAVLHLEGGSEGPEGPLAKALRCDGGHDGTRHLP